MANRDKYYILKTLREIELIQAYSKWLSVAELANNPATLDGIVFRMIQMSEHMNNVSLELRAKHAEIEWTNIKGFRNRLVHNYGNVDLTFVYNAISEDIPKLKANLESISDEIEG